MKYILLLFSFLPMLGYAQEMPIAIRVSNVFVFSPAIIQEAQLGMDSIALTQSKTFEYNYDSVGYQNDSTINLFAHKGSDVYADRMVVKYRDDTLWTTPDPEFTACLNMCKIDDCVGGCYKKTDCGCDCTISGGCSDSNLGISMIMTVGELCRQRILISNEHRIPEE